MNLAAYRKERAGVVSDENALSQLAEYYDEITYDVVNQIFVVEKDGKFNFIYCNEFYAEYLSKNKLCEKM